ncbi:MAG: ATP-binding protein [Casimicrobiaceae bacterium]
MKNGLSRGLTIGMVAVILLALAQLGVSEYGYRESSASHERSFGYAKNELALETARRNLADAQTSQLEFLLTGRSEPLARYTESRGQIVPALDGLRSAYVDEPGLADRLKAVRTMADSELKELDTTVELFRAGRDADVRQRIQASVSGEALVRLRADLETLAKTHQTRIQNTTSEWHRVREISRAMLIVLTLSVILMFLWVFRSAETQAGRIVRQKQRVEVDNERLESMVRARTTELSELASYLHKVREDERRSLARELHDELGSILTAARLDIAFIKSRCAKSNPELVPKCERISGMLDQGTALKRRIIDNLRPSTRDMLGLAPAARDLVESFSSDSQITVDTEIDEDIVLRNDDALALYRMLQEALANVSRHAQASAVTVELGRAGELIHVLVRDNGKGFDPLSLTGSGHGLSAMRQRIRALGGKFSVKSAPGAGTTIDVWMPFRPD